MRLEEIVLENFMAYKGKQAINFETTSEAPVILFLGENGHGKTTVQRAAKWCLYGDEGEFSLGEYINRKALTNQDGDKDLTMSVTLKWKDDGKSYSLVRFWSPFDENFSGGSHAILSSDGSAYPAASIEDHVQRFLAKEISHFFFYDGETQKKFDEMAAERSTEIKVQIEKTLSLPVISQALEWISQRHMEENKKLASINIHNQKVRDLTILIAQQQEKINVIDADINSLTESRKLLQSQISTIEKEFENIAETAKLAAEKNVLVNKKKDLLSDEEDIVSQICGLLSRYSWISLNSEFLTRKKEIEKSNSEQIQRNTNQIRDALLRELKADLQATGICPTCGENHSTKGAEITDNQHSEVSVSDLDYKESKEDLDIYSNQLILFTKFSYDEEIYVSAKDLQKRLENIRSDLAKNKLSLDEINLKIAGAGSSKVEESLTNLRALNNDLSNVERAISKQGEEKRLLEAELSKSTSKVEKEVSPAQRIQSSEYTNLKSIFGIAKDKYMNSVRERVQVFSSEVFLKMISMGKYIGLRINDNYGVELVLESGKTDPLKSTGQGKIASISLVSGLIRTAMDEGFIMMDTPFVSLDMTHRKAVCAWAEKSGLRVYLFMHSGEFQYERDANMFGHSIHRVYEIRAIDDDESVISERKS